MKLWKKILLGVIMVLVIVLVWKHSLIYAVLCNVFAPAGMLDESTDWAGGQSEHLFYGDSESQYVDLYVPEGVENPPLFVLVHGGAFVLDDAQSRPSQFMYRYFRDRGYACATVNYRLAAEAAFPAACEDVHEAVVFLCGRAEEYGYSTEKIAIWGESAGAYLATREALTETEADISALVAYYGIYDMPEAEEQFREQGIPKWVRTISNSWLKGQSGEFASPEEFWMRKAYADWTEEDRTGASVSAIAKNSAANPDLTSWLFHGRADITVPHRQSVNMADALRQRYGEENVLLTLKDGYKHGDDRFYADEQLREVDLFLQKALE